MIRLDVDLTNPGQFFGCCGVFELAQRLWPGATGHFEGANFLVSDGDLAELIRIASEETIEVLEPSNQVSSAIMLAGGFDLRLDWWKLENGLKTWAGQMSVHRIAAKLQRALPSTLDTGFFDDGRVLFGADGRKFEPYCFDARRGVIALPLDVGFSSDALSMETVAFPATEFFTLIGLQRFRPLVVWPRTFRYRAWPSPLPVTLAALVAAAAIPSAGPLFQFESARRSKYNKAFSPAIPVNGDGND